MDLLSNGILYRKGLLNLEKKPRLLQQKNVKWLFLTGVIFYTVWVSLFTSTVHIEVDEELYVTLAKSFHYLGRFEKNGQILDYSCVLYSMLLSLAYYCYTPESILFLLLLCWRTLYVFIRISDLFSGKSDS